MDISDILATLTARRDLRADDARRVFDAIMAGEATPAQIAAVLAALRAKGETVAEIAGAAAAMRAVSAKVEADVPHLVDTCGTGGAGAAKRFNVSTAAAFAAAAGGAHVAKHGNRAASSRSGSADMLEAAGANLELDPEQVARCIRAAGVGFLFAPKHHGAMRHAGPVRRELGIATVFNLLGPLTNPAGARRQVIGVSSSRWLHPLAEVSQALGAEHVLVVHCDGLDELSIHAPSQIVELSAGGDADGREGTGIRAFEVSPEMFGLRRRPIDALAAESPQESLELVQAALSGAREDAADIVALNAGAALYAAGVAATLAAGVALATDVIASGQAAEKFREFLSITRMMGEL